MIYLQLFWTFFKIGLFGFGGGYAMVSMIRVEVVDHYQWMKEIDFADLLAISQMTPGAISINTATFVGYTQAGFLGSLIATLALCMPSVVLMAVVLRLFFKNKESIYIKKPMEYMMPVVGGLIVAGGILMCNSETFTSWLSILIFVTTIVIQLTVKKANPILLIIISGICGWIFSLWEF